MKKIILWMLLSSGSLLAQNQYYVATTGSDSNTCTSAAPCLTIARAISVASIGASGAQINVASGTYHADITIPSTKSGTGVNARLVLLSTTQYGAKITTSGTSQIFTVQSSWTDIVNFEIIGDTTTARGNYMYGTNDRFIGNKIHEISGNSTCDGGGSGAIDAQIGANFPSAIGNIVYNVTPQFVGQVAVGGQCNHNHGIYFASIGGIAQDNIVYLVSGFGIESGHAASNLTISNNTLFNNGSFNGNGYTGGGVDISCADSGCGTGGNTGNNDSTVINNIIYQNPGAGIRVSGTTLRDIYANNIVNGNGLAFNPGTITCTNCILTSPLLVNFQANGTGDYHPTSSSPAIQGGTATGAAGGCANACVPATDFAGLPQSTPKPVIGYLLPTGSAVGSVKLTPTSLAFGNSNIGAATAPQAITILNNGTINVTVQGSAFTGANPGDFQPGGIGNCQTNQVLAPTASCTVSALFQPAATGARTANYSITDTAAGSPHIAPMTGTGTAPVVSLSSTSLAFGSVQLGSTSAIQSSTLTNTGNGPLNISSLSLTGADATQFTQSNTCGSGVAAGANCVISVTFKPTTLGAKSASISIADNATGSPQVIALSGTGSGTPNPQMSPTNLTFTSQLVGSTSSSQPVTFTNNGNAPLTISSIGASGDFSQTNTCPLTPNTLAALASCTINVAFSPTAPGTRSGTLTAISNAPGSPTTAALTGAGIQGAISLAPTAIVFGPQNVGTSSMSLAYNTPTSVTPISYPATIPCPSSTDVGCPTGALHGTNWSYADAQFPGSTFVRVTDVSTPAAANPHPQFTVNCGGSAETSPMSINDDRFYVCSTTAQIQIFSLAWPVVTHLYNGINGNCVTGGNNFCTNNLWFSRATNDIAYTASLDTGASGSAHLGIYQYDFSSTSTYTRTLIKDLSQCVPSLGTLVTNVYIDDLSVSNDDQTFAIAGSTATGQDNSTTRFAVTWNRTNGCRVWNTFSGVVTGDYGPTGTIAGVTDTFSMHNMRISITGDWAKLAWANCFSGSCSLVGNYYWHIPDLVATKTLFSDNGGGHQAIGSQKAVNVYTGTGPQSYFQATWQRNAATTSIFTVLGVPHPTATNLTGFDVHFTWPKGEPNPVYGTSKPTYSGGFGGALPVTNAWDGEALAWSTDGSGTVYRLFHLYNSFQCTTCFYNVNALGALSSDGQYYLYTTDWNGMLGNADGVTTACTITSTCRGDVFLVKMPLAITTGQVITISNTGTATVNISSISLGGTNPGDFSQVNNCGPTLATGANCAVTVTFTPTATGSRTAILVVADDAPGSPHTATITGTGTAPVVSLTPSSVPFGNQITGSISSAQNLTLSNTGTGLMTISSIALTGANANQFTQSGNCGTTLAAGANCTIAVRFAPTANGAASASLTVTDNAAGSPHSSTLSGTGIAGTPIASLTPTSMTFAPTLIGVSSASQTATLSNTGTGDLAFSLISTTGDFSQTNNCISPIVPLASCQIQVKFTPTVEGSRTGTLSVTDNASGSPHTTSLSGLGTTSGGGGSGIAVITPSSLTFSSQVTGISSAPQNVNLQNTDGVTMVVNSITFGGGNPTDYAETDNCLPSLGAGASCTIHVTFTPLAAGSRPATLVFNDSSPTSPQSIPVSGTGIAPFSIVNVVPTSLNFGSIQDGSTTANQTITVKNVGTGMMHISGITKTGTNAADYGLTNGCGATLAVNATCTLTLNFTPGSSGTRTASVSIASDDPNSPTLVPMTGVGTPVPAPKVSLSASSLTFPLTQVGLTTPTQTVKVSNIGDATLTISSITLGAPNATDFILVNPCGGSIVAGAFCNLTVSFKPVAAGTRNSTVILADNAADTPQSFSLTGTAFVGTPTADLSVGTLIYTNQIILTTSASQTIALTNNGTAALAITSITATSDLSPGSSEFAQVNNCGSSVPAGGACTVQVTFTPQATGARTGKVTFIDNAAGPSQIVVLMGTGVNPPPPPGNSATGMGGHSGSGGKNGIGVH